MDEKELLAFKYVVEKINGNNTIEYKFDGTYGDSNKELGMYINKFLKKGLLSDEGKKWYITGGRISEIYRNNILMIHYDMLYVTEVGKEIFDYEIKSKVEKQLYKTKKKSINIFKSIYKEIKSFISELYLEMKKQFIKWIVYILGLLLFVVIGKGFIEWIIETF